MCFLNFFFRNVFGVSGNVLVIEENCDMDTHVAGTVEFDHGNGG